MFLSPNLSARDPASSFKVVDRTRKKVCFDVLDFAGASRVGVWNVALGGLDGEVVFVSQKANVDIMFCAVQLNLASQTRLVPGPDMRDNGRPDQWVLLPHFLRCAWHHSQHQSLELS